jgi:hypothetical protein
MYLIQKLKNVFKQVQMTINDLEPGINNYQPDQILEQV